MKLNELCVLSNGVTTVGNTSIIVLDFVEMMETQAMSSASKQARQTTIDDADDDGHESQRNNPIFLSNAYFYERKDADDEDAEEENLLVTLIVPRIHHQATTTSCFVKDGHHDAEIASQPIDDGHHDDNPTLRRLAVRRTYKKYVHFPSNDDIDTHQRAAPKIYSTASISDLWYSSRDFAEFRRIAHIEASWISNRQESQSLLQLLEESFSITSYLAGEVCKYRKSGHSEDILWDLIFQRLDINQSGMMQWCCSSEYRGLEYLASKPMRQTKHLARKSLKRQLKRHDQPKLTTPLLVLKSNKERRNALSPEKLAEKLQRRSQQSRLFARMMGVGDEMAALHVYQT